MEGQLGAGRQWGREGQQNCSQRPLSLDQEGKFVLRGVSSHPPSSFSIELDHTGHSQLHRQQEKELVVLSREWLLGDRCHAILLTFMSSALALPYSRRALGGLGPGLIGFEVR